MPVYMFVAEHAISISSTRLFRRFHNSEMPAVAPDTQCPPLLAWLRVFMSSSSRACAFFLHRRMHTIVMRSNTFIFPIFVCYAMLSINCQVNRTWMSIPVHIPHSHTYAIPNTISNCLNVHCSLAHSTDGMLAKRRQTDVMYSHMHTLHKRLECMRPNSIYHSARSQWDYTYEQQPKNVSHWSPHTDIISLCR